MVVFFFNDTATTEIYTLSLHDALPIFEAKTYPERLDVTNAQGIAEFMGHVAEKHKHTNILINNAGYRFGLDRKSTRLNSSHANISYAVFCLKKKNSQLICTLISFILSA